ncbi:hypothetical protein Avbf_07884 [Armadillidium vulgare]|nr:hypothetical protein Avbf_07884 [Armadillidium vulgare]
MAKFCHAQLQYSSSVAQRYLKTSWWEEDQSYKIHMSMNSIKTVICDENCNKVYLIKGQYFMSLEEPQVLFINWDRVQTY